MKLPHCSGISICVVCLIFCNAYLRAASKELWHARKNRVLYALGNCLLSAKVS